MAMCLFIKTVKLMNVCWQWASRVWRFQCIQPGEPNMKSKHLEMADVRIFSWCCFFLKNYHSRKKIWGAIHCFVL